MRSALVAERGVVSTALLKRGMASDTSSPHGRWFVYASKRASGEWHLHGGKVEVGEDCRDAAQRKSWEEIDVITHNLEYVVTLAEYHVYLYATVDWLHAPWQKEEHTAGAWVLVERMHELQPALPSFQVSQNALLTLVATDVMAERMAEKERSDRDGIQCLDLSDEAFLCEAAFCWPIQTVRIWRGACELCLREVHEARNDVQLVDFGLVTGASNAVGRGADRRPHRFRAQGA